LIEQNLWQTTVAYRGLLTEIERRATQQTAQTPQAEANP